MNHLDLSGIHVPSADLDSLTTLAYDVFADGKISFGEVVTLGGVLAGRVNQFVKLSGLQKQAVVRTVLEHSLQRVLKEKLGELPEEQLNIFRQKIETAVEFVKETLPSVLTLAVHASRGVLNLGKAVEFAQTTAAHGGLLSCLTALFPLFPCIQHPQAETPSKAQSGVQLEMKEVVEIVQSSKETPDLPPEEASDSQVNLESNTASQ